MNHTPKPSPSKSGPSRPWSPRLFAIGAVLLLVASGLVVVISGMMRGSTPRDAAQEQSSYATDALARINTLGSLDGVTRGRDLGAADIGALEVEELARELAAAQAGLEAALAAAEDLPAVPEGYVPGTDVAGYVPSYITGAYPKPAFVGELTAPSYLEADFLGTESPLQPRDGLHAPKTGNAAVDDALSQLVGACVALKDLLEQAGTGNNLPVGLPADPCTIDGLEGLPVEDPTGLVPGSGPLDLVGILGPLPVQDPTGLLGGAPAPGGVQEANDAVDPDEAGAVVAQVHAGKVLGAGHGAFAQTDATLRKLLDSYSTLAKQLEDLLADAEAQAEATKGQVSVVQAERLASITAHAEQLRGDAERLADAYAGTTQTASDQALGLAKDAVDAHLADLQSTLDAEVAGLNAEAGRITSMAASRSAAITALVDSAKANLTRMAEESGVDASAQVAAIQASGDAAIRSLEAQAKAEVETLKESAALLQARAQAAVPRMTGMGIRATETITQTRDDALAKAEAAKGYVTAFVAEQVEVATAAEQATSALALVKVDALLEGYTTDLKTTGLAMVNSVPDVVNSTAALVEETSDLAGAEVGKDLDYIAKVASDYSKVPTDERKVRAQFWSLVNQAGEQSLVNLDETGVELSLLAMQVMQAAEAAQAEVERIAA